MGEVIAMCDGSYLAYAAASAGEKRSIGVTHRSSGKYKAFKNKTEFKSWIKEQNSVEREEPLVVQDFDMKEYQMTPEEFDYTEKIIKEYSNMFPEADPLDKCEHVCYRKGLIEWWEALNPEISGKVLPIKVGSYSINTARSMLKRWQQTIQATKMIVCLDHGETFRHRGVTITKYKDRPSQKALNLQIVKDWLQLHAPDHGFECLIVEDIEADDRIAQFQEEGWVELNRTAKKMFGKYVNKCTDEEITAVKEVCDIHIAQTVDKDNAQTNGLWHNPYIDGMGNPVMDEPKLVFGIGGLYLKGANDKDVGGLGFKWLCFQTVFGDKTDTFSGTKLSNKLRKAKGIPAVSMGVKAVFKRLDPLTTKKECLEEVINIYKELYPWESFEYNHWQTGEKITATWKDVVQEIFMCAYMLRCENDPTTFESLCKRVGVENYG